MHVLELAKVPQEQKNETDLMQWMVVNEWQLVYCNT